MEMLEHRILWLRALRQVGICRVLDNRCMKRATNLMNKWVDIAHKQAMDHTSRAVGVTHLLAMWAVNFMYISTSLMLHKKIQPHADNRLVIAIC